MRKVSTYYFIFLLIALFAFSFTSCEKKEEPIILPAADSSLKLLTTSLGPNYDKQIFVNLENQQTTVIENNCWDLYFDADPGGYLIYMNGGKGVLIANANTVQFKPISDPTTLKWKWDDANGSNDSLVLSKWIFQSRMPNKDSVYVIDRGSQITDATRYMQFKIIYFDATKYILQIANLDGSNIHNFTIQKDPSKAHVYFSFDNDGTYLNFEPDKNNWHFCFLRYRYVYYQFSPPLLYSVTGIFINNHKVQAAIDSTLLFANVNYNNVQQIHFSHNRDAMGFDWKVYNFTNGRYTTRSFVNYIVKSNYPLKYYKIRFIDFYDDNGLKGTPRFEVQGM